MGSVEEHVGGPPPPDGFDATGSLMALESDEQRKVLDIVTQLRKCGLEGVLSLPQLVVCGDQSAGKSSVLEALTEIPFPRNDNLCTRFATEITLRRAQVDILEIKVIPDPARSTAEKEKITSFSETILNFDELPALISKATDLMGIGAAADLVYPKKRKRKPADPTQPRRAFAKDTLSITIEGPNRPQLTVVDLPGIVQSETKITSPEDVALVSEITEHYISQPRTICLAIISATHDYANQEILSKVRKFDKEGERTLGIITKPDRLDPDSGLEHDFISLARNEDIRFKLGWHVLKNRKFEEASFSLFERNASEDAFFRKSSFGKLPPEMLGIHNLVSRISQLLFAHIQQVLPSLQEEANTALQTTKSNLERMGESRVTSAECRGYMTQLGQDFSSICKAAVQGNYEEEYFSKTGTLTISSVSTRRLRAIVQLLNQDFSDTLRLKGYKFYIPHFGGSNSSSQSQDDDFGGSNSSSQSQDDGDDWDPPPAPDEPNDDDHVEPQVSPIGNSSLNVSLPERKTREEATNWVRQHIKKSRGRELPGNFNPLVIGELFWEQSSPWYQIAKLHADRISDICNLFLSQLLQEKAPKDIYQRVWPSVQDALASRSKNALTELSHLYKDIENYPINYNHYYTDTIAKRGNERQKKELKACIAKSTTRSKMPGCTSDHQYTDIDVDAALDLYFKRIDPDLDKHSCDMVLDCLYAIYKVNQKVFMANVTTQVVERHIIRELDQILSPMTVAHLSDKEVQALSSEPKSASKLRQFLAERIEKLDKGREILRQVARIPAI